MIRAGMMHAYPSTPAIDKFMQLAYFVEQASRLVSELRNEYPHLNIPNDQVWFWSKEWQAGEHEVDNDLKNGNYKDFDTVDDLLAELHSTV